MLIATPNLCLDRTVRLTGLVPGAVLRADGVQLSAGGKGVNVARVVRACGGTATIVGLVGDNDRERLLGLLAEEGADVLDVPVPGDVRITTVLLERALSRTTVVNEPGPAVSAQSWQDYRAAVERALPGRRVLVCAGSLPPGAPLDGYGQLVELAHRTGVPAVVDTAPAALRATLASGPDLVTPNLPEAEAALAGSSDAVLADTGSGVRERARLAASRLCSLGARAAAVTAGAQGCALALAGDPAARWVPTVPVAVLSAVGAGDSFVAGVVISLVAAPATGVADWYAAAVFGTATAAASCEQLGAGAVDPERVRALAAQLEPLATPVRSGA